MHASRLIPTPFAVSRRRTRDRAGLMAVTVTLAGIASPVALTLVPLAVAHAWRNGSRLVAGVSAVMGAAEIVHSIDLSSLNSYPAALAGPWLALLIGTVAASVAGLTRQHGRRDALRAAALVALVAAPWSPLSGIPIALGCWIAARLRRPTMAANDNDRIDHRPPLTYAPSSFNHPPLRSARPAGFD